MTATAVVEKSPEVELGDGAGDTVTLSKAELAALLRNAEVAGKASTLKFKVSTKGALSVYGLQRWPITLYANQWEVLLKASGEIRAFMLDNREALAKKPA